MPVRVTDVSGRAFRAFVRTSGLFRGLMEPYFLRFGISGAQWGVLRALQRAEAEGLTGLRLGDLGRRLLVKPPSVTSVVDRLERSGLVARREVAADQRVRQVVLTGAGRELVGRVLEHHPARVRGVMGGLSREEQQELSRLMEKLGLHLEGFREEGTEAQRLLER